MKRICVVEGCDTKHHANGYCQPHGARVRRWGDPFATPGKVDVAARLEDVHWMAETGESLSGSASRLGLTANTLEKWLARHDRACLSVLIAREPKDHNRLIADVSIAELTGLNERRARQPYRINRRRRVAA